MARLGTSHAGQEGSSGPGGGCLRVDGSTAWIRSAWLGSTGTGGDNHGMLAEEFVWERSKAVERCALRPTVQSLVP